MNVEGINLYPHQKFVIDGLLRNPLNTIHTVLAPRQRGKSILLQQILLYYAFNKNKSINIAISPTNAQNRKLYQEISESINRFCPQFVKKTIDTLQEIVFTNGSQILFKSAAQRESLRGYTVSGILVMDECAFISDDIFYTVLPFTNVHKAPVVCTSTPKFKTGFFYENYIKGLSRVKGYKSYNMSDFDTSFLLSNDKLEMYRKQLPRLQFQCEYLGEFIDSDSMVFSNYKQCIRKPKLEAEYCAIDWANGGNNDDTCVTFMNRDKELVEIYYINNMSPTMQIDKIVSLISNYTKVKTITVEENSIGTVYYDILRGKLNNVIKINKFLTTNKTKNEIIELLITAFENNEIGILNDEKLLNQLSFYEMIYNPKTGNTTYNAPNGLHDDAVMSLAMCYYSVGKKARISQFS